MREMKEGNKESSLAPPSTGSGNELSPMKVAYGATWLALTTYAFGFSPGGSTEAAAQDSELIAKMVSTPFDGSVSPLFVALFNALGIVPTIYAALLLPGSKDQKPLPTLPFVISAFALGFFGVGPYLALRERKDFPLEHVEVGITVLENKLVSVGNLFLLALAELPVATFIFFAL